MKDQKNALEYQTVPDLKKICKIFKIKTASKKIDIINNILKHFAIKRLQNWFRHLKALDDRLCPISMTLAIYPYFVFKPKGSTLFIYYNLVDLASYLITTGDFRDPKTREKYSEETLKKIDIELNRSKINLKSPTSPFKSVYKASQATKYYKNKKETEDNILVLERILDDTIDKMRILIEDRVRRSNAIITLNTLLFMIFRSYFRRLVAQSKETAELLIARTIITINKSLKDNDPTVDPLTYIDTNMIRDNIITFLYQVKFDEFGS